MMADYNGWADQREEECEALDQLEMSPAASVGGAWIQGPPVVQQAGRRWHLALAPYNCKVAH